MKGVRKVSEGRKKYFLAVKRKNVRFPSWGKWSQPRKHNFPGKEKRKKELIRERCLSSPPVAQISLQNQNRHRKAKKVGEEKSFFLYLVIVTRLSCLCSCHVSGYLLVPFLCTLAKKWYSVFFRIEKAPPVMESSLKEAWKYAIHFENLRFSPSLLEIIFPLIRVIDPFQYAKLKRASWHREKRLFSRGEKSFKMLGSIGGKIEAEGQICKSVSRYFLPRKISENDCFSNATIDWQW